MSAFLNCCTFIYFPSILFVFFLALFLNCFKHKKKIKIVLLFCLSFIIWRCIVRINTSRYYLAIIPFLVFFELYFIFKFLSYIKSTYTRNFIFLACFLLLVFLSFIKIFLRKDGLNDLQSSLFFLSDRKGINHITAFGIDSNSNRLEYYNRNDHFLFSYLDLSMDNIIHELNNSSFCRDSGLLLLSHKTKNPFSANNTILRHFSEIYSDRHKKKVYSCYLYSFSEERGGTQKNGRDNHIPSNDYLKKYSLVSSDDFSSSLPSTSYLYKYAETISLNSDHLRYYDHDKLPQYWGFQGTVGFKSYSFPSFYLFTQNGSNFLRISAKKTCSFVYLKDKFKPGDYLISFSVISVVPSRLGYGLYFYNQNNSFKSYHKLHHIDLSDSSNSRMNDFYFVLSPEDTALF